ncbi:MAG: hypothetical protein H9535_08595 [Ignavibacteria bacterium]|nr:hypothetical protein [Ignavibacteria bacterium]
MNIPHAEAVTLQTPDSNVVVISGLTNDSITTPICEIYERKTHRWRILGSLLLGRYSHSAVFISKDEVLVVGGHANFNYAAAVAEAEVFNIYTGKSRIVEDFPYKNANGISFTSQVLSPGNPVFMGGRSQGGNSHRAPSLYTYGKDSVRWSLINKYPVSIRAATNLCLVDGRNLIVGGFMRDIPNAVISPYICIETENGFVVVGGMLKPLAHNAASQWNSEVILIIGGFDDGTASNRTEWFDMRSKESIEGPRLNQGRGSFVSLSLPVFNEQNQQSAARILAIGGVNSEVFVVSEIEILETNSPQLLALPNSEIASLRQKKILTSPIVVIVLSIFILVLIAGLVYLLYQVLAIRRQSKFSYQGNAVEGQK